MPTGACCATGFSNWPVTWAEREVSFVGTSVDRITSATTDADRELVESRLGLHDRAPVVCEPFSDWVLCGEFPAGRPEWERVGARFVADIEPWELRKLWLLNGGHSLLAYLGLLRGHAPLPRRRAILNSLLRSTDFWDLAARHCRARSTSTCAGTDAHFKRALRQRPDRLPAHADRRRRPGQAPQPGAAGDRGGACCRWVAQSRRERIAWAWWRNG